MKNISTHKNRYEKVKEKKRNNWKRNNKNKKKND